MMLEGKNAVITGANRGIGKAIVTAFAKNGANVWACARTQNPEFEQFLRDTGKQYRVSLEPVYFDLRVEEEIKNGMKYIFQCSRPGGY